MYAWTLEIFVFSILVLFWLIFNTILHSQHSRPKMLFDFFHENLKMYHKLIYNIVIFLFI